MLVLGIDPGSITSGWALLKSEGKKIEYVGSGILEFDKKVDFLERLTQIKEISDALISELNPDEVARYKAGEKQLTGFFMGQLMKVSQGKADPKLANGLLRQMLDA